MHLVVSVHPSAHLFVCLFWSKEESLPAQSICLCVCNQWAYADNHADAVDRHLFELYACYSKTDMS